MAVTDLDRIEAFKKIVQTGVRMEPRYLLEDILTLSFVFTDLERFHKVVDIIVQEIHSIIADPRLGDNLKGNLLGVKSVHFYSTYQKLGEPEDMRLAHEYIKITEVLGFGHRWLPKVEKKATDFYDRIKVRVGKMID